MRVAIIIVMIIMVTISGTYFVLNSSTESKVTEDQTPFISNTTPSETPRLKEEWKRRDTTDGFKPSTIKEDSLTAFLLKKLS